MGQQLALDDRVLRSMGVGKCFKDGHQRINSMDFCRTEDLLVTGSDDDSIRVYDVARGVPVDTLHSRKYGVQNVCFTHDPACIVYASRKLKPTEAHALRYHSLHMNQYLRYFTGHTAQVCVNSLCFSPKNDTFVSAAQDKTVRLWDVRTNICQGCLQVPGNPTATIDQQGLVFAVATESGIIKLYDLRSYDKGPFDTFTEKGNPTGFADIKFSNNGNLLMAVVEGRIYLLDAYKVPTRKDGECERETGTAVEAAITADNQYLLTGCDDRAIRVWHIDSGREVAVWQCHAQIPACLRTSNRRVLVASACTALVLWIPNLKILEGLPPP
ncbi:hypothetical protein VOLCADRAFT_65424 [Volvox carteri f. nagariensis]|uniref:Uncharacterized protein n=1 Tax=Volvox carteri f. nagariensis TaxID=3068 RepID=D8U8L0_VOLCA|nr:uncharacterized protein VOLCADRAFT_65424 [Volvox carteri f. nagariensis]EFJ44001.1 hypothetical protein VOLCADRAFT_65424 [Volvox carteri f. nagariensis]|eukprot:XP_002955013.1 hypothetical protein VOLCADRAFT_65424 [Volvox carteri f. nagariensis]